MKAFLLDGRAKLNVATGVNQVVVTLPDSLPDQNAMVVALDIKGNPEIVKPNS